MTSERPMPGTRGPFREIYRHSVTSPKIDLGHSYLARNRTAPVRHIVEHTPSGWVQICTGQRAIRSHAGRPWQSSCGPCRRTWNERHEGAA